MMDLTKNKEFNLEYILDDTVIPEKYLDNYDLTQEIKKEIYALEEAKAEYKRTSALGYEVCAMLLREMILSDLKVHQIYGRINWDEFYELKEAYCY